MHHTAQCLFEALDRARSQLARLRELKQEAQVSEDEFVAMSRLVSAIETAISLAKKLEG